MTPHTLLTVPRVSPPLVQVLYEKMEVVETVRAANPTARITFSGMNHLPTTVVLSCSLVEVFGLPGPRILEHFYGKGDLR